MRARNSTLSVALIRPTNSKDWLTPLVTTGRTPTAGAGIVAAAADCAGLPLSLIRNHASPATMTRATSPTAPIHRHLGTATWASWAMTSLVLFSRHAPARAGHFSAVARITQVAGSRKQKFVRQAPDKQRSKPAGCRRPEMRQRAVLF